MTDGATAWREVAFLSLVMGNILAALLGGALTLGVGMYGPTYLASVWYAPLLLVLGPVSARAGADQLALGRERWGFSLMLAPVAAGMAVAIHHMLVITAGARAYDALNPA